MNSRETRPALLTFEDVSLGYGRRPVLRDVTFELRKGALLGIVGPNGSGKTTLLRSVLGVLKPLSGRIEWQGDETRPRIGYVPQRYVLDPIYPLRVRDLVMMGRYSLLGPFRRPGGRDRAAVNEVCEHLGIVDLLDRPFRDLSGGQQQRTLIARALASEPQVLVFDEPTNGMDLPSERAILDIVLDLHRERESTVLFVTHLLNLVADVASELAFVQDGGVRVGAHDDMLRPEVLSDLYRAPVEVHDAGGRTVVFVRGRVS